MTALTAENVFKQYGQKTVLANISLSVGAGECFGLFGANGSGKSTLLKVLGGLIQPDSGSVQLTINGHTIEHLLQHVGLVAPWMELYEEFTVAELLILAARLRGLSTRDGSHWETLERMGLDTRAKDPVFTLSSGWRQRVLIAIALFLHPSVLLLDEPSLTLDLAGRNLLTREIQQYRHEGGIVILATNDESEKLLCTSSIELGV